MYIGPAEKLLQAGYYPQCTLYDYYLGSLATGHSKYADKPSAAALQAALVYPMEQKLPSAHMGTKWGLSTHLGPCSYGAYPVYFVTEEQTVVLEIPKGALIEATRQNNTFELTLELTKEMYTDNVEKAIAWSWFVSDRGAISMTTDGKKSTAFALQDKMELSVGKARLSISSEQLEGDAQFMGHVMLGNRHSQLSLKGADRFNAYDRQYLMRVVRGTTNCKVKISLTIDYD
jgi:hypothetical protein